MMSSGEQADLGRDAECHPSVYMTGLGEGQGRIGTQLVLTGRLRFVLGSERSQL